MKEQILNKIKELGYEQNGPFVETETTIIGVEFKKMTTIAIDWNKNEMYKIEAYADKIGVIEIFVTKI